MTWYLFWKKSGPMGGLDETYRYYDEKPSKDMLETDCGNWAEAMPGGHNTHYSYGFKLVDCPPLEVLQKRLKGSLALRESVAEDIRLFEDEIARAERVAQAQTAQLGIQERSNERSGKEEST